MAQGRHLMVLDNQFCKRRLLPGAGGYLVATQTGSGTWFYTFTTQPQIDLSTYQAITGQIIPNLVIQGADNIMRELLGPASANLILMTNALGQLIFTTLPTATVPDPLTVADLTVTNSFNLTSGTISGTPTFTGLGTGTLSFFVGLDGSGNLIKGTPASTGVQCAGFFESPTSPSAATPNAGVVAGGILIIGNLLFDSVGGTSATLFGVTNSQTLTCLTAGVYNVDFGGQVTWDSGSQGRPAIMLLVNGVIVNNGNARPDGAITTTQRAANLWCSNLRRFAVGDTIQLQLASTASTNVSVYEARVNVTRYNA